MNDHELNYISIHVYIIVMLYIEDAQVETLIIVIKKFRRSFRNYYQYIVIYICRYEKDLKLNYQSEL